MKTHIERMLRAMSWADQQMLAALEGCPGAPTDALRLMAHLLAAEHIWLSRLRNVEATQPVWPQLDLSACKILAANNAARYRSHVAALGENDLTGPVFYRNTKGEEFANSAIDIFTHVVIHGAYHRGQIAKALGRIGVPMESTDFITFARVVEPS
jgi:uncharacterized damage-inducible protein DinB